ncbi:RAC family serine/threonine-protein kinase like protein [Tritrichomonas foetus]|uniref:non-specific serine/threonine protein kinase n=1 Tax=Tritrichomonas foetus TaxID=1144522 RepID=A0A1J4JM22_9EUKA|nr:RAC family serine/threonine-protein kinase like protein [Tritrichomonas foetus]|eukprot:OHT00169.1 RAC family serine/threonine-protein kinase like protein [Tritrichomonas foetus]
MRVKALFILRRILVIFYHLKESFFRMSQKQGWLTKQGGRIKSWKKRWFTITGTVVTYYSKVNEGEKGSINLADATAIEMAPECKKQPALKIVFPGKRTYYIQASSIQDAQSWVEAFNLAKNFSSQAAGNYSNVARSTPGGQSEGSARNSTNLNQPQNNQNQPNKDKPVQITTNDFEYITVLGRGTYGKVQLVKYKKDGQLYAMKSMSKQLLQEHEQIQQSLIERNILLQTRHPFLVSAHYTFQTADSIYMILDYVPGGELFGRLKEEQKFNESRVKLYAAEIMLGLGKLHSLNFIFRDLKPENILLDENGHIKITDFGLVKTNMDLQSTTTTFCGTPEYIAPEMLQQQPYTKSVDWWSFGILVYEMLTGLPPFYDSNTSKMYRKILSDEINFPSFISPDAQDLIKKLLDRNPYTRLGASAKDVEEIKEHPFFKEYNWDDILSKKIEPEWKPIIKNVTDTSNFDGEFTEQRAGVSYGDTSALDPGVQSEFAGFTCTEASAL